MKQKLTDQELKANKAAQHKKWREANPSYKKEYDKANKEKTSAYQKERRKSDPLYRLILNLRSNVRRYLKEGKSKRTEAILGMSFENFQLYLEADYTEGMNLDHVVPVSWATTDDEVYCLNHFSNFQVLTEEENLSKGNRFVKEENLERTLEFHNNTELLNKIIGRNLDKIT